MKGGKFQQRVNDDGSARNAEVLFETRRIADIVEVEARTRRDIEEKKEELRQLVGASYRDLIESADSILEMRRSCECVVRNVAAMTRDFAALRNVLTASAAASAAASPSASLTDKPSHERMASFYAVGSRVKYVVDSPEKIWGCLDEHMYLEAAQRYLRARTVQQQLLQQPATQTTGDGASPLPASAAAVMGREAVLAAFPLLRQQGPLVEAFKSQISQRSRERLHDPSLASSLSADAYAIPLAALVVMDSLSSHAALHLFLQSRRAWLRAEILSFLSTPPKPSPLNASLGDDSETQRVAALFARIVAILQESLCHAGQLFLEVSASRRPLLFETLLHSPPESQVFGGIPHPGPEITVWKDMREALDSRLTPLGSKEVGAACQEWLDACSADISAESSKILHRLSCVRDVAQVEAATRASLLSRAAFEQSSEWLASAFGRVPESPWQAICETLLREPRDLWGDLLEGLFTQRAKAIIARAFQQLLTGEELDILLTAAEEEERVEAATGAAVSATAAAAKAAGQEAGGRPAAGSALQQLIQGAGKGGQQWGPPPVVTAALAAAVRALSAGEKTNGGKGELVSSSLFPLQELLAGSGAWEGVGDQLGDTLWQGDKEQERGEAQGGKKQQGMLKSGAAGSVLVSPQVLLLCRTVDHAVLAILLDALSLLVHPIATNPTTKQHASAFSTASAPQSAIATAGLTPSSSSPASVLSSSARLLNLTPFLQDQCFQFACGLISLLEHRLQRLQSAATQRNKESASGNTAIADDAATNGVASLPDSWSTAAAGGQPGSLLPLVDSAALSFGPAAVSRALLLGRFATALASQAPALAALLGFPSSWPALAAAASSPAVADAAGTVGVNAKGSGSAEGIPSGGGLVDSRMAVSPAVLAAVQPVLVAVASEAASVADGGAAGLTSRRRSSRGVDVLGAGRQADDSFRLTQVQRAARRVGVSSHVVWLRHTVAVITVAFHRCLSCDSTLSTATPLKGWEDTVVQQPAHDGITSPTAAATDTAAAAAPSSSSSTSTSTPSGPIEMKMTLPACPSAYVAALLFAACLAAHRSGGHSLDSLLLRFLAWRLGEEILTTYESLSQVILQQPLATPLGPALSSSSSPFPPVSEKGLLQLLFDVRFVGDALSGGCDLPIPLSLLPPHSSQAANGPASDAASQQDSGSSSGSGGGSNSGGALRSADSLVAAVTARRKRVAALLDSLQQQLDPIDRAAYLPYLWTNEQRYFQRATVLLGPLCQLARQPVSSSTPSASASRSSYSADANTLNSAPPAPRFTFLPISSPLLSSSLLPGSRARRPQSSSDLQSSALPSSRGSLDSRDGSGIGNGRSDTDHFSASDLTGLTGTAAPIFKSLMGQVKLGSILGDSGVQVGRNFSSLAGEMLPSQAAGFLSSLSRS